MKKFIVSLGLLLTCATASFAQGMNAGIRPGTPALDDFFMLLKTEAIDIRVDGSELRRWSKEGLSSREIVRYLAFVLRPPAQMELLPPGPSRSEPVGPQGPPVASEPSRAQIQAIQAFRRLASRFRVELNALGIQVERIIFYGEPLVKPGIAMPFKDVFLDQWAFEAVELLRDRGIIVGYPSTGELQP